MEAEGKYPASFLGRKSARTSRRFGLLKYAPTILILLEREHFWLGACLRPTGIRGRRYSTPRILCVGIWCQNAANSIFGVPWSTQSIHRVRCRLNFSYNIKTGAVPRRMPLEHTFNIQLCFIVIFMIIEKKSNMLH